MAFPTLSNSDTAELHQKQTLTTAIATLSNSDTTELHQNKMTNKMVVT